MRFLFLKQALNWPRRSGHDVHTPEMMQALADLGHAIGLATVSSPAPAALAGLSLELGAHPLVGNEAPSGLRLGYLQRRFLRYWGVEDDWMATTSALAVRLRADAVVAVGLDMLPCLAAVQGPARIWYAADEYTRHHLNQWQIGSPKTWRHLVDAALACIYERAYSGVYDRAWMVSADEARAMRRWGGAKAADVAPNGVNGAYFRPGTEPATPRSCVFWGRLDAEPNVRAVAWFCRNVWPTLRLAFPDARFGVYGFAPTPAISSLAGGGVAVVADVPDLRPELRRHEVAVMPFVSGAGIKNKLLEAAALGLPIVTSPRGCVGLDRTEGLPFIVARRPSEWTRAIGSLWRDADRRARLGAAARDWVLRRHTWSAAAKSVLAGLGVKSPEVPACPSNSC